MKTKSLKSISIISGLIIATCAVMAYSFGNSKPHTAPSLGNNTPPQSSSWNNGPIAFGAKLTQSKILFGGDGKVSMALTLHAKDIENGIIKQKKKNVDMVIVLDRSGSMGGEKIVAARKAALKLVSGLGESDRFSILSYSNHVTRHTDLVGVNENNRLAIENMIKGIISGGGTNLGAGLQEGIKIFASAPKSDDADNRLGKLILISDGIANQGICDNSALGSIASVASEKNFSISSVGVGHDFNETLMTILADRGTGTYYFLDDPTTFAAVFEKEFSETRLVAASNVKIKIPLKHGVKVLDASGCPITVDNGHAVIYPGDMLSGQKKTVFVTLQVPSQTKNALELSGISVASLQDGIKYTETIKKPLHIVCVENKQEVVLSYNKAELEQKVLQDEYNTLKEEVAADIRDGKENAAMERIDKYHSKQVVVNAGLGSKKIESNLKDDISALKNMVKDVFAGAPAAVQKKRKSASKQMQHEGYKGRRSKK